MGTRVRGIILGILAVAAVAGCNLPGSPSGPSLAGTWTGTMTDGLGSHGGTATLVLQQSGTSLSGRFTTTLASGMMYAVHGSIDSSVVSLTLTPSGAGCLWSVALGVTGDRMKGTAGTMDCRPDNTSAVDLTKQ